MRSSHLPFNLLIFIFLFFNLFSFQYILAQPGWYWQNPLPQGCDINTIQSLNNDILFAAGTNTSFLKSSDGGNQWECKEFDSHLSFTCIHFLNNNTGFLIRNDNKILKTTSGGDSWQIVFNSPTIIGKIKFITQNYGLAYGNNSVYKTTNGGNNWFLLTTISVNNSILTRLNDVYSPNENIVKCLIFYIFRPQTFCSNIWETQNGGQNWSYYTVTPTTRLTSYECFS